MAGVPLAQGTLQFTPGETIKFIPFAASSLSGTGPFQLTLTNPVNAELTGRHLLRIAY